MYTEKKGVAAARNQVVVTQLQLYHVDIFNIVAARSVLNRSVLCKKNWCGVHIVDITDSFVVPTKVNLFVLEKPRASK